MPPVDSEVEEKDETANFIVESSDNPADRQQAAETPEAGSPEEKAAEEAAAASETGGEAGDEVKPGDDATADAGEKKQRSAQKRIDKITREKGDVSRELEKTQRERDDLKKQLEGKAEPKADPKEVKLEEPKSENFDSYDLYLDAMDAYEKRVNEQKPAPEAKAEPAKEEPKKDDDTPEGESPLTDAQLTARDVVRENIAARMEEDGAKEMYPDLEAVLEDKEVPFTGEVIEAIAECEDPVKVMYHLGKNKDLAKEIAGKTPVQIGKAIANLDSTVAAKPPKPKQIPQADSPIEPVKGSDVPKKAVADMSFSEHEAYMNEQEQQGVGWGG